MNLRINGKSYPAPDPARNLLSFIRFEAGLTGAKSSCGEGLCGACTVLVDGEPVRSCTTTVGDVAGTAITTIEGLAKDGVLHPVQRAFVEQSAMQCGYCIPGFILMAAALLDKNPKADPPEVRDAVSHNTCRCGTYKRILAAVQQAAREMSEAAS